MAYAYVVRGVQNDLAHGLRAVSGTDLALCLIKVASYVPQNKISEVTTPLPTPKTLDPRP
eukprot:754379-Rhodomonas_salina.2